MPRLFKITATKPPHRPKSLSSSPSAIPTHEEISHLILQQKTPSKALQTFEWASEIPSFHHNPSTYHSLIRSLISFNHLQKAHQILISSPSPLDSSFLALVRAMGRARWPTSTIVNLIDLIFPPQRPPSTTVLNSVLDVLVRTDIDSARDFFRRRVRRPDDRTFGILMKGLCGANRIAEAFKLLRLMKSSAKSKPNAIIYNTLLHGLCRNGKIGRARSLMGEMKELSCVTFNIMMSAYCGVNNLVQALVMLEKCFECGFVPDEIAVTKVVGVLCGHGRAMEAVELLDRVEDKGGVVDVVSYNCLIKGFCSMGKPEVGRGVLKEMERKGCLPNVHTYNALVSGFCDTEKVDSAMDVFREMGMVGVGPNFDTFDWLIRGFCLDGRVDDGLRILDLMEEARGGDKVKVSPYNNILYGFYKENKLEEAYEFLKRMESLFPRNVGRTSRILGFCKEGKVGDAKMVYDQMVKEGDGPNALVYDSLIEGLSVGGNVRDAFDLMNEMVEGGHFPVVSTFNALIHGFCEEGNLSSARKLLDEMVSRGCSPTVGCYGPLISALCRQGDYACAYAFLVQMVESGVVPDEFTWSCLLLNETFVMSIESTIQTVRCIMQ